ncbi:hypothetical protein EAF04_007974 [Stromatinia cepivora]|nr:hypothetical protein EAF04_007974 [Stromatinia cepivora]
MGISKDKQQQLRAAKGEKGKKKIREERRATRAGRAQASLAAAGGLSIRTTNVANFSNQQQLVFRYRSNATNSALSALGTGAVHGLPASSCSPASQAQPAAITPRPHSNPSRQTFSARIAAAAARRPRGRHHKRSWVPSQKERLSRRETFREFTGLPLAALGVGHNLGGSVAPDIVGNWPAEVLGKELLGSDDEEEEDMEDDDDDDDDGDDEEMKDGDYDSEIYDSDGNEWASLGVNMKEGISL